MLPLDGGWVLGFGVQFLVLGFSKICILYQKPNTKYPTPTQGQHTPPTTPALAAPKRPLLG
jgi:hypothetical protein